MRRVPAEFETSCSSRLPRKSLRVLWGSPKNTPPASDIVMCDDGDEVEEEYRPVSTVAGPLMGSADRHTQSRLKRKLVIDSETEIENSPAFKKKSAANSSSSPIDNKKRKNR